MFPDLEKFQTLGKAQMEAAQASASGVTEKLQALATEATEFSKSAVEKNTAFVEKMMGVRQLDEAVALQTAFAKSSYEGFVSQMSKMSELYTGLAKEAFKPVERAFAQAKTNIP